MASAPLPESAKEPARLCEICRGALDAALRDDGPDYEEVVYNDGRAQWERRVPARHAYHLAPDDLPGLPRLYNSARAGCDFCAFLRDAILSEDADDVFKNESGSSLRDVGQIQIEFAFDRRRFDDTFGHYKNDLIFRVAVAGVIIDFHVGIEGVAGAFAFNCASAKLRWLTYDWAKTVQQ